ncbi:MFS transporter [Phytohabitans rumicis]|uniref:MFS transporter n=1 Tax=Phytohabitans rumicis TaxID=1076125 RepID=UPI0015675C00|nr:MFS transporter [Phytohabitans rumicis]
MTATREGTAWAPLRIAAYRNLWLALLAANIGTWMQTVGAQWLLVSESDAATPVALVQTASMLPILLLALPAGVLADAFDKRHLLIAVQLALACVGLIMTVLTATGHMGAPLLLTLTFALGTGQALTLPAWAASIPELVPRGLLRSASALGSISVNVARAIGPAVAGLLIAETGVTVVFALNTVSFLAFAAALVRWRPGDTRSVAEPERFTAALRAGGRYVRHSRAVRRLLRRVVLFILPGSALWALLPLVARHLLGTGSHGYGVLLGALGIGAIGGGLALTWVRGKVSASQFLATAGSLFAGVLLVVAAVRDLAIVAAALVPAGAAWVIVLANLNAEMQLFLPGWVRARGLAVYQVVFAGGQALGALAWGLLAEAAGLVNAFIAAAALMLLDAMWMAVRPLPDLRGVDRERATVWPELRMAFDPDPHAGPVLVTAVYTVRPEQEEAFVKAMRKVRGSRQQTGAMRWGLFRVGEEPQRFVEVYQLASWDEHQRQHGERMTGADQETERRAVALAEGPADVRHLLPALTRPE